MNNKEIPIVFATNNDYTYFCYTAIFSLIKNASPDNFYNIFIFVTNVEEKNRRLLESLSNSYVSVACIDISDYVSNVNLQESYHLSVETYYRLFIPVILPEYKKVLYLDSDLCVFDDVEQLYNIDMEGYSVAAAVDVPCEYLEGHAKDLGDFECLKMFNAGVLLMDTELFEQQKIREKCLKLLAEDYKRENRKLIFADQDALNTVLYNNFKKIDGRWNYQPQFLWRLEDVFEEMRDDYVNNSENPYIMHYAGVWKPWNLPDLPKANTYWGVVKDSPIFMDVLKKIICAPEKKQNLDDHFSTYMFPYDKVAYGSKVALYAAGRVGKTFYEQLNKTNYAECVIWVDKKEGLSYGEKKIENIDKLSDSDYDHVVIAIESEDIALGVKKTLIEYGVDELKIVWKNYIKRR